MKTLFLFTFACLSGLAILAQDSPSGSSPSLSPSQRKNDRNAKKERLNNMLKMEEEGELVFNKHSIFGIKLATDGYGISYEKGKYKTNTRTLLFQFELNEKKSVKEHKITSETSDGINSFIVGKENNFYQFKMAVGQQHRIGGKGNKNGVAVTGLYTGGLSLGLLKPYLINVVGHPRSTYPTVIDSSYEVEGAAGFFAGWGQLKVKPGLNAKTAMRFDYGRFNESITAIEVGLTGEYYFSKIPQMAYIPMKNFFFNAYLTILFGRRK